MHILAIGLNHKTAPVEVREVLALGARELPSALSFLKNYPGVSESVILSTCNRTEVYLVSAVFHAGLSAVVDLLTRDQQVSPEDLRSHLYILRDLEAVRHLLRVTCGLDSMILGETQILGQVREAYQAAQENQSTGKVLNTVFNQAIATGKRGHSETEISKNAVSVSYAAVELAKKVFQSLEGRRVLIIGAGKMSELTAKHLLASGVSQIVVANRTPERAESMARMFNGIGVPISEVDHWLPQIDVVISSTGAPHLVLTREMIQEAIRHRRHRPIFLFDIAVPRDIDPEAGRLEGVFLYDIDDLESAVQANLRERQREARKVERIIDEEVGRFESWHKALDVVPVIRSLRQKAEDIRRSELTKTFSRLPDLTEREKQIIEAMSTAIINKILNDPTLRLKEYASGDRGAVYAEAMSKLFNLRTEDEPCTDGPAAAEAKPESPIV